MSKQFNLYLTKKANVSLTTRACKRMTFTKVAHGIYGYSTDNKQEIAELDEIVEAGGIIYVDQNTPTIDRKIEFTRKPGAGIGSAAIGATSSIQAQARTESPVVSQEASQVTGTVAINGNLASGVSADSSQLGQAVNLANQDQGQAVETTPSLKDKLAAAKK